VFVAESGEAAASSCPPPSPRAARPLHTSGCEQAGLGHQRRLLPSRVQALTHTRGGAGAVLLCVWQPTHATSGQVLTAQGEPRCITLLGAAADSAADAELDTAAADAIVQPALDRATGAAAAAVLRAPVGGGERRRRRSPEPRLWGIAVTAERVIVSTSGALYDMATEWAISRVSRSLRA